MSSFKKISSILVLVGALSFSGCGSTADPDDDVKNKLTVKSVELK